MFPVVWFVVVLVLCAFVFCFISRLCDFAFLSVLISFVGVFHFFAFVCVCDIVLLFCIGSCCVVLFFVGILIVSCLVCFVLFWVVLFGFVFLIFCVVLCLCCHFCVVSCVDSVFRFVLGPTCCLQDFRLRPSVRLGYNMLPPEFSSQT